jgi:hypothetical protein
MIAEEKRVVMDTAIDNAFYVFNEDGTYIRFSRTSNGMYCIDINTDEDDHVVMAHQTIKGESVEEPQRFATYMSTLLMLLSIM